MQTIMDRVGMLEHPGRFVKCHGQHVAKEERTRTAQNESRNELQGIWALPNSVRAFLDKIYNFSYISKILS